MRDIYVIGGYETYFLALCWAGIDTCPALFVTSASMTLAAVARWLA